MNTINDLIDSSSEASSLDDDVPDRKKRRLQISLWTLLLLIAACGVWIAYANAKADVAEIEAQLPGLRFIARELVIDDPKQFAAVERLPSLYDEHIWDVYVPELQGKQFELRLAMDKIPDSNLFEANQSEPIKQAILMPGKHTIEFQYHRDSSDIEAVLVAIVDGETVIEEIRPHDWVTSSGFSSSSSVNSQSKAFKSDGIIQLIHRRYMVDGPNGSSSPPKDPGPGVALWIATVD